MKKRQPRIVIIGAGPSGLLTAHYLSLNGYRNVTVLEKLGWVGGLAHTITYDGRSFDLGANYVTPAYKEILTLAKELGATTYAERPFIAMKLPDTPNGHAKLGSIVTAMRIKEDGQKIPMLRFMWLNIRYIWKRYQLSSILDRPTFAGVERHPELAAPFEQWLNRNNLSDLRGLFLLPVNLMGYGTVDTTPALYALKFMTLKSYVPMLIKEAPIIGRFSGWPRRFTDGFQRFFERLSWRLNVRVGIDVTEIRRDKAGVHIRYRQPEQILDEMRWHDGSLDADHLILACPLTKDVIGKFLDVDEQSKEGQLLSQIHSLSYCMTTRSVTGPNFDGHDPLAACYPLPEIGYIPWGVAKQWDDCDFTQFYTRVDPKEAYDSVQERVEDGVRVMIEMMGGKQSPATENWQTYNRFPYFQHVSGDAIAGGWYTALENQQGVNNTWYVGGATNFELIEPIAEYAKNLVATHFPKQAAD
jgi:hypothetical protein